MGIKSPRPKFGYRFFISHPKFQMTFLKHRQVARFFSNILIMTQIKGIWKNEIEDLSPINLTYWLFGEYFLWFETYC